MGIEVKQCRICKNTKPFSEMVTCHQIICGVRTICKKCHNEERKIYYKKNRQECRNRQKKYYINNKNKFWKDSIKYRYNISEENYMELLQKQKGLCAICGLPESCTRGKALRTLSIDHNHLTGRVRGLLCQKCNTAIGLFNMDNFGTLNLEKAIKYYQMNIVGS